MNREEGEMMVLLDEMSDVYDWYGDMAHKKKTVIIIPTLPFLKFRILYERQTQGCSWLAMDFQWVAEVGI